MDLQCPRCGMELEVERMRMALRVQCPDCKAVFRADEGTPRARFPSDNVIDINAEAVPPATDVESEDLFGEVSTGSTRRTSTSSREKVITQTPVYVTKKVVIKKQENGCGGCGGCGCLILLFLFLLFLFGCAAATSPWPG